MITISDKAKQFSVFLIKLLIVIAAFYFIYYNLSQNSNLDWDKFFTLIKKKQWVLLTIVLLAFSFVNRFLEIIKWQNLVSSFQIISIGVATKQVLAALTAGIFTPNGLGEYAGKCLYFEKKEAKRIVFLNLLCNGIQLALTIFFGTIGLFLIGYWKWALIIILASGLLLLASYLSKKIKIKGYSIQKLTTKVNEIPKTIHQKNIVLGIARYLTFSHQYYFLFITFGVDLPYISLLATIAVVYFLASSLPSFQFLDFVVKGSVALFFFGKLGVNEWVVVFISMLMWFLNVAIPVIIGSYFVFKFKPKWN